MVDEKAGLIKVGLESIKLHGELVESIVPMFVQFARNNFTEFF